MRRYFIPLSEHSDLSDKIHFTGDIFHHIFDVCRHQIGSRFEVLIENTSEALLVEVIELSKKSAIAVVKEKRIIPELKRPHLHLALSIPKFPVFDSVIEKAVELGVKSVQPFFSDYSFIRSEDKISSGKRERWQKIIISATQQSGRGDLMCLEPIIPWDKLIDKKINQTPETLSLFAYEGESITHIKDHLISHLISQRQITKSLKDIWIIAGSEGGFSQKEVQELTLLGLHPVTIGSQVLRVETACIALISVLKYEFDLMC